MGGYIAARRVTPSPNYLDSDHSGLIIPPSPRLSLSLSRSRYFFLSVPIRCSVRRYANRHTVHIAMPILFTILVTNCQRTITRRCMDLERRKINI